MPFPSSLALAVAVAAQLPSGSGATAPLYPGNTIKIEAPSSLVAATVQKVKLSGHANWGEPTSATTTSYSLSMYVQNPEVDATCSPNYGGQLQKSINLPGLNASQSITGFVVQDNLNVSPTPPEAESDWSGESLPFAVKPGLTKVLLCAYVRYITDDVASYGLEVPVTAPRCKPKTTKIRRGRALALSCNLSGTVTVKATRSGRKARTLTVKAASGTGAAKLSTRTLAKGSYTLRFSSGKLALGSARVRVT
jgi:hypothetical protein